MLEHDASRCLLFLLVDHEGAAVVAKVAVDLFDNFWQDSALVVIRFADGVGRPVEESVLLLRMPVEVEVHEDSVFLVKLPGQILDEGNLGVHLPVPN